MRACVTEIENRMDAAIKLKLAKEIPLMELAHKGIFAPLKIVMIIPSQPL